MKLHIHKIKIWIAAFICCIKRCFLYTNVGHAEISSSFHKSLQQYRVFSRHLKCYYRIKFLQSPSLVTSQTLKCCFQFDSTWIVSVWREQLVWSSLGVSGVLFCCSLIVIVWLSFCSSVVLVNWIISCFCL